MARRRTTTIGFKAKALEALGHRDRKTPLTCLFISNSPDLGEEMELFKEGLVSRPVKLVGGDFDFSEAR